jgi:hypothetical protein
VDKLNLPSIQEFDGHIYQLTPQIFRQIFAEYIICGAGCNTTVKMILEQKMDSWITLACGIHSMEIAYPKFPEAQNGRLAFLCRLHSAVDGPYRC